MNDADVDLLATLFWADDPRFCEVENDQPMPFGKERFLEIADRVREHGRPGDNQQRFHDTGVCVLAPDVAHTVCSRDELNTNKTSRVTLILLRKGHEWRIIQGPLLPRSRERMSVTPVQGEQNPRRDHPGGFARCLECSAEGVTAPPVGRSELRGDACPRGPTQ